MKKIFFTLAIIIASISGFSQAFSVDNKSLSVPRYANQAAITAAILTPTEGMLVFNNALDTYSYYNGTAWVNFPTQTNPIDSTRIISAERVPSLQALKSSGTVAAPSAAAAGRIFNIQAYGQTSATASALSGEISFRATQAFDANNSGSNLVFSTRGAAAPLTDRMMIHQDGRFGFGSISTAGYIPSGNMDLNFLNNSEAVPTLHLRGSTTIIRYSRNATNGPGAGIVHTNTINNNTAAGAFMAWKHYDDTVIPIAQTPMMTLTGEGNLTVNGFTKLGGSSTFVPAIKQLLLTGTTAGAQGNNTTLLITTVPHSLPNFDKILSTEVYVKGFDGSTATQLWFSDSYSGTKNSATHGNVFSTFYDATNVYIERPSGVTGGNLAARPYRVLITYTN
jgi:hypothetical protein